LLVLQLAWPETSTWLHNTVRLFLNATVPLGLNPVTAASSMVDWPATNVVMHGVDSVTALADMTFKVSEAVPPVPPSVELTGLVVLTCAPALIPVTLTENVHEEAGSGEAVRVPPDKLNVEGDPGGLLIVAVMVPLPHEPVTVVEASCTPPGNESVNATPLNALTVFGLVTVKLNVLLLFSSTLLGLNDLLIVGGAMTVNVSEAVPPVPPSVELTVLVVLT